LLDLPTVDPRSLWPEQNTMFKDEKG
jgi:hypothetical protein